MILVLNLMWTSNSLLLIDLSYWMFRHAFRECFFMLEGVFYRMQLSLVEVVKCCALTDLSFSPILFPQPPLCTQVCCLRSIWQDCNSFPNVAKHWHIFNLKGKTHIWDSYPIFILWFHSVEKVKHLSHAKIFLFFGHGWIQWSVIPGRNMLFMFHGVTTELWPAT